MSTPGSAPLRCGPHALQRRRRRIREGDGDQTLTSLDRQADFKVIVRVDTVVVQLAAFEVVFRRRNQHARIRPRELAADHESLDERVIHADLDLMLVLFDAIDGTDRAVALQLDREHVFAIERKDVMHRKSAVRGERQLFAGRASRRSNPSL